MSVQSASPSTTSVAKQPSALSLLFFVEMWERFGFYVVQGLLVLYATQAFHFSDEKSYTILGVFSALVYIMPVVGGYLADNLLGYKRAIILGGVLLAVGYAALGGFGATLFYVSLAIIIMGNGFFKPNISSLLGALYKTGDERREAGFTIFYMGINLGSLLATGLSGFIQEYFGWAASFLTASAGLIIGVITFIVNLKKLEKHGEAPIMPKVNTAWLKWLQNKAIFAITLIVLIGIVASAFHFEKLSNLLLIGIAVAVAIILGKIAIQQTAEEKNGFLSLIFLILVSVVFWAIFFQIFSSASLFIDRDVNRYIGSFQIPTVAFLALEAVFILILGPFLANLWRWLYHQKINFSVPLKFALSMFSMTIGFLLLWAAAALTGAQQISPWWIVISYLFVTLGELLLSPIGLSMITVLSPARFVGMMMGIWFVALGFGGKFSGIFANFASLPQGTTLGLGAEKMIYAHAFFMYSMIALAMGVLLLLVTPILQKLMGKEHA